MNPQTPLLALPYNECNKIIDEKTLRNLLDKYEYNHEIKDIALFHNAMVHKSYCVRKNEDFDIGNSQCPDNCIPLQEESNERLEFLGDAVLSLIVGTYLFQRYFDCNEGFLTKLRTKLVNGKMLANLCSQLDIGEWFIISKQNEQNNGRDNPKILEDTFEALLGAMYLNCDCKLEPVTNWLINLIEDKIDMAELIRNNDNYKDQLIKHYQQTYGYIPKFYEYGTEVINNQKMYSVCLKDSNGNIIGTAKDTSKKSAENKCAKLVLEKNVS